MTESFAQKPLRVVYVGSPPLFSGGASAIHVMKMCQAMSNLGMRVELLLPHYKSRSSIFEHYGVQPNFKVKTIHCFTTNAARHVIHGGFSALSTYFNKKNFDIAVTRNIFYAYLATGFFRIPTIYDAHHPLINTASHFLFNSFKGSEHLKRFSTNSMGLGNIYLKLGLPKEKLVVAPNGVDLERFEKPLSKDMAREILGLPKDKKIVCYAGNTYRGRGIEALIDIAAKMKDVFFVIVGGLESDNAEYRHLALEKRVNNFKLMGFVKHQDVPIYLSAADVLIMPYTSQVTIKGGTVASDFTSPIKLFEYMAARRPIVATAIPAVKEVLRDNENAVLVKPDSEESLITGIKKIIEDDAFAVKLADAAYSDVTRYTWEERVKKLLTGLSL